MSTIAVVWLVVGLLSITATLATLIGLVRHVIVVGRAAARFQGELAEMAGEIADLGRGAGTRLAGAGRRPPTEPGGTMAPTRAKPPPGGS